MLQYHKINFHAEILFSFSYLNKEATDLDDLHHQHLVSGPRMSDDTDFY